MLIIGVQNTKGGATKSTTSVNLSRAFQKRGCEVALGETDPQGTLREWVADNRSAEVDGMPKVIQLQDRNDILSVRDNPELEGVEVLIIDGVANGFREILAVSKVADFLLIVTQPSPADVKPIGDFIDILEGKDVKTAFLLTRTKKGDDLNDIIKKGLDVFGYPVLENTIRDLKGFKTSFGAGRTVFEFSDYKAAQDDVSNVVNEILEILGVA